MRKEVPLQRLGKPQNQNCKGLINGRRCQIRTAIPAPKAGVLPLHYILYEVAMRPWLQISRAGATSLRAQISLNTALEQLSFNRWLWVWPLGAASRLELEFRGHEPRVLPLHYAAIYTAFCPDAANRKKNRRIKMPFLVLGWAGGIRTHG